MNHNNTLLDFLRRINDHNIDIYLNSKLMLEDSSLYSKINIKSEWPGLEPFRKHKKHLTNYYNRLLTDRNMQDFITHYSIITDYCLKCVSRNGDIALSFPHSKDGLFINLSTNPGNDERFYILQLLAYFEVLHNDLLYSNWVKTANFLTELFSSVDFIQSGTYPNTLKPNYNKESTDSVNILDGDAPDMDDDSKRNVDDLTELIDILFAKNKKYKRDILRLNEKINAIEIEYAETVEQMQIEFGETFSKLNEEHNWRVNELQTIIDLLNARISELETNADSLINDKLETFRQFEEQNSYISNLERKIGDSMLAVESLEKDNQELRKRYDDSKLENDSKVTIIVNLESRVEYLLNINNELTAGNQELSRSVVELTASNGELNVNVDELNSLLESLHSRYTLQKEYIENLQKQYQELEMVNNENESVKLELQNQVMELEEAIKLFSNRDLFTAELKEYELAAEAKRAEDLDIINTLKKRITEMSELHSLQRDAERDVYEERIKSLQDRYKPNLADKSSQTEIDNEDVNELLGLDKLKDTYISSILKVLETGKSQYSDIAEENEELTSLLQQANNYIDEISQRLAVTQETLSVNVQTLQTAELTLSRRDEELSRMKSAQDKLIASNQELSNQSIVYAERINSLTGIEIQLRDNVNTLTDMYNDSNARLIAAENVLNETRNVLANQLDDLARAENRIKTLTTINEANNRDFGTLIANMQQELDSRENRIKLLDSNIINIMQDLNRAESNKNEYASLLEYIKRTIGSELGLNQELPIQDYILALVEGYRELRSVDVDALQMLSRELASELDATKKQLGTYKQYRDMSESEYNTMHKELLRVMSEKDSIKEQYEKLLADLKTVHDGEVKDLNFTIEKLNNEVDIITLENQSISDNYRLLGESHAKLQERIKDLKEEIIYDKNYYKEILAINEDLQNELNEYRAMYEEDNEGVPEDYQSSKADMYSEISKTNKIVDIQKEELAKLLEEKENMQRELDIAREDISMYKFKYKTIRKALIEANADKLALQESRSKFANEPKSSPAKKKKNIEYVDVYDSSLLTELYPGDERSAPVEESKFELPIIPDPKQQSMKAFLKRLRDYEDPSDITRKALKIDSKILT